tara:strand:+ start:6305 stop:7666 length:1362 start_codon:yes stop_codon:yes gene_type:complete
MSQRFLAPAVTFEGIITQKGTVSNDEHVVTRGYLHGNVINGIHPDSANYASVVADGGVNKLKIDPLTITSVTVNTTATDLADFIQNVYTGSNFQEGDIVFLTTPSPIESYIHNGGVAGTAADWNLVNSGLSDAQIRAMFSASAGIDYNAATGAFTADQSEIQGFFSAGTGIAYSGGQFSLSATSDQISEGVSNLFYTDLRSRASLSIASVAGPDVQLLQYNNSTGVFSVEASDVFAEFSSGTGLSYSNGVYALNADTSMVSEAASALYFTTGRVDAHLSGGTGITYSSGVIALNADTSMVSESASALYFTDSRARSAISVDLAGLSYNSGTGQIALNADTDDIAEGSRLYHTTARARNSIQADPAAGNLVTYNQSSGDILVALSSFRKGFANQTLTANTALNLTHSLGERLVHVSAMDGSGNKLDLEIVYTSTSVVQVKSTVSLSGIDIAVSI